MFSKIELPFSRYLSVLKIPLLPLLSVLKIIGLAILAEVVIVGSALAQQVQNGGGGDAPFAQGVGVGLNWVFFLGAAIAVFAFLAGCFLLYLRQVMAAGGAFLFVLVGAALMANSNAIITRLTGLTFA